MAASIDVAIFCVPSLIVKNNYIIEQLLKKNTYNLGKMGGIY